MGKWEILGLIDESVNSKTRILLQYSDFHGQNVNEAWSLLEWVAWDSFEFEKASCVSGYSFPVLVHSMVDRIILLFGVNCVIPLTITLVHIHIMHIMLILIHLYL